MKIKAKPDTSRPLSRTGAYNTGDARWAGVKTQTANRTRVHEAQRRHARAGAIARRDAR